MPNQSRMQFSESNKMNVAQFASSIKEKFPQYQDVEDDKLSKAMIQKYPQYRNLVEKRPVGQRLKESFSKEIKNIPNRPEVQPIIGAAKSIGGLGVGLAQLVLPKSAEKKIGLDKAQEFLEAKGTGQKIGKFTTDVATFFVPGGASLKASKVVELGVATSKLAKLQKPAGLVTRMGTEGVIGGGITAAQTGEFGDESKQAALIGAALPGAGAIASGIKKVIKPVGEKMGARVINSLVKPKNKDLAYSKNPGRTVSKLGLTANSQEGLFTKVGTSLDDKTSQLTSRLEESGVKFDFKGVTKPLDDAMVEAIENNDQGIIDALEKAKKALTQTRGLVDGKLQQKGSVVLSNLDAVGAVGIKRKVGKLTKFTANISDDKAVNSALQGVYRLAKKAIDDAVPGVKKLSGEIADLISAQNAIKGRLDQQTRNNLVGLGTKIIGTGAGGGILAGGGAIGAGQDPKQVAKALIAGTAVGAIGAFGGSTVFKTRVASLLAKDSKSTLATIPGVSTQLERIFGKKFTDVEIDAISNQLKTQKKTVTKEIGKKSVVKKIEQKTKPSSLKTLLKDKKAKINKQEESRKVKKSELSKLSTKAMDKQEKVVSASKASPEVASKVNVSGIEFTTKKVDGKIHFFDEHGVRIASRDSIEDFKKSIDQFDPKGLKESIATNALDADMVMAEWAKVPSLEKKKLIEEFGGISTERFSPKDNIFVLKKIFLRHKESFNINTK